MAINPLATVIASTLVKSRKKLIMAAVRSHALMSWAFASERVEYEDGGRVIENPLTIGRNPNIASYSYYQPIPISQTNEFTTVSYGWTRFAGTVIISGQEEDENRGETMIFKLLKAKLEVLEESIKEVFGVWLYGSGAGTDPNGLGNLIPLDPTTGTLGGIDRAAETQWRTSSYAYAGALDNTNIEEALDDITLDLSPKGEKPTVGIMGRNILRTYLAAARDKVVINLQGTGGKRMVDLGFEGFTHKGIPHIYDEDCNPNRLYYINDKYLRLHILKHVNMKNKDLTAPWDTDATGQAILWQGQWCMWKAFRSHAVVDNN